MIDKIKDSYFIVGPTASGKSKLAISLAKQTNGQIINADSMQIYVELNIGTAKTTPKEQQGIKHHLLDIVHVGEDFSVAQYKNAAFKTMIEISKQGYTPIVCGGTGLYINALTTKIDFTRAEGDKELRKSFFTFAEQHGNKSLHDKLKAVDLKTAARLHPNDVKRVVRALEVYELTRVPLSEQGKGFARAEDENYNFSMVGLEWPRATLIERINKRVDIMIENGLLDEAKNIYNSELELEHPSMMAIGYRQLYSYFKGEIDLPTAVEDIKIATRQYAKRQMTWFKRDERILWLDAEKYVNQKELTVAALDLLRKNINC